MIKKRFVLGFFAFVFLAFLAVGANTTRVCVNDNQIIISLYDLNNSHGALWNDSNYGYKICYTDVFGVNYTGVNSHLCNGNNTILKLSNYTNAHAESSSLNDYNTNVCFGDMSCTLRASCLTNESLILSLSNYTNAHLAVGNFASYNNKLCCVRSQSPAATVVVGPKHKGVYYVNVPINFNYPGNNLKWWDIGNGSLITSTNFNYAYTTPGEKVITYKTNNTNGVEIEQQIAILVLDNSGIFAFIESPSHKEVIISDNLSVNFSARDSFVLNSSTLGSVGSCTTTVNCLGGSCPNQTENSPNCSADTSAKINITDTNGQKGNFSNLLFNWRFYDANDVRGGPGIFSWLRIYPIEGDKLVGLSLDYNLLGLNFVFNRTFTVADSKQCMQKSNGDWIFIERDGITGQKIEHNVMIGPSCKGLDKVSASDDCCPSGFSCTEQGCRIPPDAPTELPLCENYTTQTTCESDTQHAARNSPLWDSHYCGTVLGSENTKCKCAWLSGQCIFNKIISNANNGRVTSSCNIASVLGECVSGYKTINYEVIGATNDPLCVSGTDQLPCGKPAIALPLFGFWQFGISVICIGLAYLLIGYLNRKRL